MTRTFLSSKSLSTHDWIPACQTESWAITCHSPKSRRKVWKSGGSSSNVVRIICPTGSNRVSSSAPRPHPGTLGPPAPTGLLLKNKASFFRTLRLIIKYPYEYICATSTTYVCAVHFCMYNCTLYFQKVETRCGKAFEFDWTIFLPISLKWILKESNLLFLSYQILGHFFYPKITFLSHELA